MLPLYPPYPFLDLAHEHLGVRQPAAHRARHGDPDGFLAEPDALQPDPVFMGLRAIVTTGPIGAITRWIEGKAEIREDPLHSQTAAPEIGTGTPAEPIVLARDDGSERKIAA